MSKNLKKIHFDKNLLFYLPFVLVLGIVPLVVKTAIRKNPLLGVDWYPQNQVVVDFFLYWKSVILIITAVIMIILLVYNGNAKKTRLGRPEMILIPILLLTFFEIMSSLLSVNSQVTLHGMPDQFESIWVMLAYSLCLVYSYICLTGESVKSETITIIMLLVALPIELICIGQYFGQDIFRYIYSGEGYSFTFNPGEVYGTFYNVNYVGSYVVLLLPCCILAVVIQKKIWVRILAFIESMILLISLYGAISLTGIMALVFIALVFVLVVLLRKLSSIRYRELLFWMIAVLVLLTGIFVGKGKIENYLASCDIEKKDFEYVITDSDNVEFGYRGNTYHLATTYVESVGLYIMLLDDEMNDSMLYEMTDENGIYYASDMPGLEDLKVRYILVSQDPDVHGVELSSGDIRMCFSNEVMDGDGYYYYSQAGVWTRLTEKNASKDFKPLEKLSGMASGRGYIWNKTIAVLPQYILFGSGADTFACVFPNDDFVDNMNNGYSGLITTKPHNMYLQYAIQSGVLSLICLLVLFAWYILKNLKLILTTPLKSFDEKMNFALFLGILGYMVTGLANDSSVTVAPVFWTLFGIGLALMNIISKRNHNA